MFKQLLKRIAHRPMTERDLLEYAQGMIRNPPVPDDWRSQLSTITYDTGRNFFDKWRDEFKIHVGQIAAEKTWALQRDRLLHLRIASRSWVSLHDAIGKGMDVALWAPYVRSAPDFAQNPEGTWVSVLAGTYFMAMINEAVLSTIGRAWYGIDDDLENQLTTLAEMRKDAYKSVLAVDDAMATAERRYVDGTVRQDSIEALREWRREFYEPTSRMMFNIVRELGDRIVSGTVDAAKFAERWKIAADQANMVIQGVANP